MADIEKREFRDVYGGWMVGATVDLGEETKVRWCELPADAAPRLREMVAELCARALAQEGHARTRAR